MKRTILVDLDGVLNNYNGEFEEDCIPPIKQGAVDFLEVLAQNFTVKIFTTRNKLLAAKWVIDNNIDKFIVDITNIKEPAWLIIDDRCIQFSGDYEKTIETLKDFKAWYK